VNAAVPMIEERVLVFTPWGRDAQVISQVLGREGLGVQRCASFDELLQALREGAGLTLITEEVLQAGRHQAVLDWIDAQPAWSDFPLVVLATRRSGLRSAQAQNTLARLGNLVLLERPLHAETLLSAATSALRARRRQYEIRRHLLEQERAAVETSHLYAAERRAREESFSANEKLAFALDSAELGTFHCPLPLRQVFWNATCCSQFWHVPDEADDAVALDTFYGIVHPGDRTRFQDGMAEAVARRTPLDIEFRTVSPQGESRWIRAKGMAYGPPGREPTRFDGITIDIGAQKAMEVQRETLLEVERNARLDAEHASRMKDEFLATLSHELRTPLTAIIGWIHVLRRQPLHTPESVRAVDTIDRNARVQAKLIEDLLDMSRIISGHVRLDLEVQNLHAVLDAVLASLEPVAGAKRLRVLVQRDGRVCPVSGDPARLQQIIWNLLSNAIKFTPADGEVNIRLTADGQEAVLTVEDDGVGIPAEFLPFVFERFRQNDASATRAHGGLGLGLAIVKNLVELHGGAVQAASDGVGLGARFSIRLPIATPGADRGAPFPDPPCLREPHPLAGPATERDSWTRHDLSGFRILVIDDEPDLRELLRQVLQDCGATVIAVDSASEALARIEDAPPDLMISDIGMPDLDGYQLMRQVRKLGGDLPAIALTAFAGPDDRTRALDAGYRTHVAKPVSLNDLMETVAEELHSIVRE
jgi:signal transduction histidine kinase